MPSPDPDPRPRSSARSSPRSSPGAAAIAVVLWLVIPLAGPAAADALDEIWLGELRVQLMAEQACDVAYYLNVRTVTRDDTPVQQARAVCMDARQFDASRAAGDDAFTLSECGVQVCEVSDS